MIRSGTGGQLRYWGGGSQVIVQGFQDSLWRQRNQVPLHQFCVSWKGKRGPPL